MAFRYTEAFEDLQPGDLRGVQRLYGPAAASARLTGGADNRLSAEPTESIVYQLGSIDAMMDGIGDFLALGKMEASVPWNHVELPRNAEENSTAGGENSD